MVDSADIYFIQHFADIYFSKSVCISVCGGIKCVVLTAKFHFVGFVMQRLICYHNDPNY